MVTPSHLAQESCTPDQIAAWLVATEHKCQDLQRLFAEPWNHSLQQQTFLRMSELVHQSLAIVRVLSATLQANREALRAQAAQLREQATQLSERSARAREQSVTPGPSVEEIRAAEQPMLAMFNANLRSALCGPRTLTTTDERAS